MRRLSYLLLLPLLLLSCRREAPEGMLAGHPTIQLTVQCDDPLDTKAGADGTQDGEDYYNENLISWVDIFFYPADQTDQDATYHIRLNSGKRRGDVFLLDFRSDQINDAIFPVEGNITYATVFVVANYPGTLVATQSGQDVLEGTSLPDLEAKTVTTSFEESLTHRQTRFLMSGTTSLVLNGRKNVLAASGTVRLERYACKLTMGVSVIQTVNLGDEVWHPVLSNMSLYLDNGVKNVSLGGEAAEPEYFSYEENPMLFGTVDNNTGETQFYFGMDGNYYQTFPTYMYPQHWEYRSNQSPTKEPFIKLMLTWVREADPVREINSVERQFYYKIFIPDDTRADFKQRFARNNWYHINVNVGILGAETDEAAVPVWPGQCYVVYWQDKDIVIKKAEIGNARYLSVDRNHYDLHNVSTAVQIPFTSSHPVKIENGYIRATRPYYGKGPNDKDPVPGSVALGGTVRLAGADDIYPQGTYYLEYDKDQRMALSPDGTDWVSASGNSLVFKHVLNNDYTAHDDATLNYFDYSPYDISFAIVHQDLKPADARYSRYRREITIKQRPAVYIEAEINTDPKIKETGPDYERYAHNGYVLVDGGHPPRPTALGQAGQDEYWADPSMTTEEKLEFQWHIVYYTGGSPALFNIHISVLPQDSDFVIGDPRTPEVDNLRNDDEDASNDYVTAAAMEGGTRSLQWYYPTEKSDRTYDMMAPSYRIASKFGGVEYGGITYERALSRCATYQEDGYPAGRWRLPTRGEVRFIAMLSANKSFEKLFSNAIYWSAHGAIQVSDGNVTDSKSTNALPRCVYDSWYWDKEDRLPEGAESRMIFTWGDRLR